MNFFIIFDPPPPPPKIFTFYYIKWSICDGGGVGGGVLNSEHISFYGSFKDTVLLITTPTERAGV